MNPKDYSIEKLWYFDAEKFINSYEIALFSYVLYNFDQPVIHYEDEYTELETEQTDYTEVFDKKRIFNTIEYEVNFIADMNSHLSSGSLEYEKLDSINLAFIIMYLQKKATDLAIKSDALLINDEKREIKSKLKDISLMNDENKKYLEVLISSEESADVRKVNAKQKIIYLNELGVIDYLLNKQPFNTSVNSLAAVLSPILGENTTTIQSYLNPLINKDTSSHNHPYSSKKAVDRINDSLNKIGFKK